MPALTSFPSGERKTPSSLCRGADSPPDRSLKHRLSLTDRARTHWQSVEGTSHIIGTDGERRDAPHEAFSIRRSIFRYAEPVDHHLGGRDRSQGNHSALAGIAGIPPLSRPDVDRCKTCVKDFGARRI
jgi:hypothetical protein